MWARPPGPRRPGTATRGTGPSGGSQRVERGRQGGEHATFPLTKRRGRSVPHHRAMGSAIPRRRGGRPRKAPSANQASLSIGGHCREWSSSPSVIRAGSLGGALASSVWGAERREGTGEPSSRPTEKPAQAMPLGDFLLKEERTFEFTSSPTAQCVRLPLPPLLGSAAWSEVWSRRPRISNSLGHGAKGGSGTRQDKRDGHSRGAVLLLKLLLNNRRRFQNMRDEDLCLTLSLSLCLCPTRRHQNGRFR